MNSPAFVYCYSSKEREVIVGRCEDVDTEGWKRKGYTVVECSNEEELYEGIKDFRMNEWIVTIMSNLSLFEKFLNESSEIPESRQKTGSIFIDTHESGLFQSSSSFFYRQKYREKKKDGRVLRRRRKHMKKENASLLASFLLFLF